MITLRATLLMAAMASLVATPCHALIVKTWNGAGTPALINTTAPVDDPGFHNLPTDKTGIYLGGNLFLTVYHADPTVGSVNTPGSVQIAGGTFPVIPGSGINLANPSTFGGSRNTANGSLTVNSDIRLYRIGVDTTTGLTPEELDPAIRRISIASRLPNTTTESVTMVGKGLIRQINATNTSTGQNHYNAAGAVLTNPADWSTSAYRGFAIGESPILPRPWQWGTNVRTTASPNGVVKVGQELLFEGSFLDTIGFAVRFDEFGLTDEAQGAAGDSGGPVFWKEGDEWVLAGMMHGIYTGNGQPTNYGLFGSFTAISSLAYSDYSSQITDARSRFSKMGDINLDGVVTGGIVNGVATGDLAVLVNNWMSVSAEADVHSWMKGDLNLDGRVDLADFVQLRSALGGTISASAFAQLVAGGAIPEPSTLVLALAVLLAAPRRRG